MKKLKLFIIFIFILIFFNLTIFGETTEILSIDDVINKIVEISKMKFGLNLIFVKPIVYFGNDSGLSYDPFMEFKFKFSYKFDKFTNFYFNFTLGNDGKLNLPSFNPSSFNSLTIKTDKFLLTQDLAGMFNLTGLNIDFAMGYEELKFSEIPYLFNTFNYGLNKKIMDKSFIHLKIGTDSINLGLYNYDFSSSFDTILYANFLNLLVLKTDIFTNFSGDFVVAIESILNYFNVQLYLYLEPYFDTNKNLGLNTSVKLYYYFDEFKFGKFLFSAFYELYNRNYFSSAFYGYSLNSSIARIGSELVFYNDYLKIGLIPMFELNLSEFQLASYVEVIIGKMFILLKGVYSPIAADNGLFFEIGTKL